MIAATRFWSRSNNPNVRNRVRRASTTPTRAAGSRPKIFTGFSSGVLVDVRTAGAVEREGVGAGVDMADHLAGEPGEAQIEATTQRTATATASAAATRNGARSHGSRVHGSNRIRRAR